MPPPADPAPNTSPSSNGGTLFREGVTAVIALALVSIALWMLWDTYGISKGNPDKDAYQRQKDILLLALGFLGTVTGYYLGRVPAERQADAARETAKVAQNSEQKVKQQVRQGLTELQQQNNAALGGAAANPVNAKINSMLAAI